MYFSLRQKCLISFVSKWQTWSVRSVEIINLLKNFLDNLLRAREIAKRAENESEFSEVESLNKKKREVRKPERYTSESERNWAQEKEAEIKYPNPPSIDLSKLIYF